MTVPGSKFEGTGFENEQIGHIHVPLDCLVGTGATSDPRGLLVRDTGEEPMDEYCEGAACLLGCSRKGRGPAPCLGGLGNRVTLGDDLRNPAWDSQHSSVLWNTSQPHL